MIETCEEMGLPTPEFVELGGQFRVSLFLTASQFPQLDETDQAIVDFLARVDGSSVKEIAAAVAGVAVDSSRPGAQVSPA